MKIARHFLRAIQRIEACPITSTAHEKTIQGKSLQSTAPRVTSKKEQNKNIYPSPLSYNRIPFDFAFWVSSFVATGKDLLRRESGNCHDGDDPWLVYLVGKKAGTAMLVSRWTFVHYQGTRMLLLMRTEDDAQQQRPLPVHSH